MGNLTRKNNDSLAKQRGGISHSIVILSTNPDAVIPVRNIDSTGDRHNQDQ